MTLKKRLLWHFLVIGLLPLAVAATVFLSLGRQMDLLQTSRELNGVTRGLGLQIEEYFDEIMVDAEILAQLPDIRSMDPERQAETLALFDDVHHRYDQLAIISLDGQILVTSKGTTPDINVSHIKSFQAAVEGRQSFIVAPHLTKPDQLVLHMHTPIVNDQGQILAVLGSPILLSDLEPMLADARMTGICQIFILGSDQAVLIEGGSEGPPAGQSYASLLKQPADFLLMGRVTETDLNFASGLAGSGESPLNAASRSTIHTDDGVRYLVSYKPLPKLGWTVVIRRPVDEVLAATDVGSSMIGWSLAATLLACVALAAFLARRIATPIQELAAAANALQVGNSIEPLPKTENQDLEIRSLIEAFASMRGAVSDREKELRDLSLYLEDRVVERTKELAEINRRLKVEIEKHTILEKELIVARDSAESANRAKSVFLATMSHELRTPLTAIIGFAEMLQEDQELSGNRQTAEDIDSILRSADHLLSIINDVLNLAKIEAERMEVQLSQTNIHKIIEDACIFVLPLLEDNGNIFSADIHPQLDQAVWSDELKIRQILINLLSNAAKFTEDGEIHLIARLESESQDEPPVLRLTVADTGIGIQQDHLPLLFEPFVQLDNTRTRKYPGTGLGLALTQRLCQILGGDISVNSVYEEGSSFTVTLPVQVEPIKI